MSGGQSLAAQRRAAYARKKRHREAMQAGGVDWRPFRVVPASVRVAGDPAGMSRPTSHCERLPDGSWTYAKAGARESVAA